MAFLWERQFAMFSNEEFMADSSFEVYFKFKWYK